MSRLSRVASAAAVLVGQLQADDPIIGGQGDFKYEYLPDRLQLPPTVNLQDAHGWVVDAQSNIILTYVPKAPDTNCMLRWAPDGSSPVPFGPGAELCAGTPHGLHLAVEDGVEYLYHANNNEVLHKTSLDAKLLWSVQGAPTDDPRFQPNKPTWFATPPGSDYIYMADGYGSNFVHVYSRDGKYAGKSYGGPGTGNGTFQTCHSINFDPRSGKLVVTDRENHRHQYFDFDLHSPNKFDYLSEFTIPELQRPCNMRFDFGKGNAIIPSLEGPVGIVDSSNKLVSLVNVSGLLGDKGHLHPHDATMLPNGDMVVATWNPGKLSYWRRMSQRDIVQI